MRTRRVFVLFSALAVACSGNDNAPAEGEVAVNEIDADADWVELYNNSDGELNLDGLTLADSDGAGGPKLDNAITFPADTTIAPGGSVFILAKQEAVVGPGEQAQQTACDPGPSPCFYAPFGLSKGEGDEIFLLDGDTVISSAAFPPDAAEDGETWCRVPDGTGELQLCAGTPGNANQTP